MSTVLPEEINDLQLSSGVLPFVDDLKCPMDETKLCTDCIYNLTCPMA